MKQKLLLIIIITSLIVVGLFIYHSNSNRQKNMDTKEKTIELKPTNEGPFKYYQLNVNVGDGVTGKVYLNNQNVYEFSQAGNTSTNEAQNLIKNGQNEIRLEVASVDASKSPSIKIRLNALNEQVGPTDENAIILVNWKPENAEANASIKYVFNLKR